MFSFCRNVVQEFSDFLFGFAHLSLRLFFHRWSDAMQVLFESRDPEGVQWRQVAVRRLRFVLRRLTWLVPRARVQLADVNGPRGGVDKQCRVELKTAQSGTVVITAMARDWHAALDMALARSARTLVRVWRRGQASQRPARAALPR
jgi:ribosome-associated translation inhibitor RaiA